MIPVYRTMLCANDFGSSAPLVLRHAMAVAESFGGKIVVLHVVEPLPPHALPVVEISAVAPAPGEELLRWEQARRRIIERLRAFCNTDLDRCGFSGGEVIGDVRVVRGQPAEGILEAAAQTGADVIVMGTHRRVAVGEAPLGSTASTVLRRSPVPVLLVPTAAGRASSTIRDQTK